MGTLAADRLRFFGSWCPNQQTVFCQNREGCGDCIVMEEHRMLASIAIRRGIAA